MRPASSPGERAFLAIVTVLAVIIYVGHGVGMSPRIGLNAGDEVEYHLLAKEIAAGHGLTYDGHEPTSFRPPLLPAYVGAVYAIFGPSQAAGRVAVGLLCATLPLLLYWNAMIYLRDRRAARIAAVIALGYWPFIRFSGLIMSDLPFVCFMLVFLGFLGVMLDEPRRLRLAIGAGAALGLGALCRPTVFLLPVLLLPVWFIGSAPRPPLRNWAVMVAAACLVIAPWSLRNYRVHHGFVAVSTQGGYALWQHHNELPPDGTTGTNPTIHQHVMETVPPLLERVRQGEPAERVFREYLNWRGKGYINWLGSEGTALQREFSGLDELQTDRLLRRKALEAIRANPARFVMKVVRSGVKFWEPYGDPDVMSGVRRYNILYAMMAPLALIGAVTLYRRGRFPWAIALFMLNFNLMIAIIYTEERYRLPVDAGLVLLASAGIMALFARSRRTAFLVIGALLVVNGAIALFMGQAMNALRGAIHGL